MFKHLHKLILIGSFLFLSTVAWAETSELEDTLYLDKTKLVSEQISVLKDRLSQAKSELVDLQRQQDHRNIALSIDRVNKQLLDQVGLAITIAKSNLDNIEIELSESQQATSRLEKNSQEIENQVKVFNIFG